MVKRLLFTAGNFFLQLNLVNIVLLVATAGGSVATRYYQISVIHFFIFEKKMIIYLLQFNQVSNNESIVKRSQL